MLHNHLVLAVSCFMLFQPIIGSEFFDAWSTERSLETLPDSWDGEGLSPGHARKTEVFTRLRWRHRNAVRQALDDDNWYPVHALSKQANREFPSVFAPIAGRPQFYELIAAHKIYVGSGRSVAIAAMMLSFASGYESPWQRRFLQGAISTHRSDLKAMRQENSLPSLDGEWLIGRAWPLTIDRAECEWFANDYAADDKVTVRKLWLGREPADLRARQALFRLYIERAREAVKDQQREDHLRERRAETNERLRRKQTERLTRWMKHDVPELAEDFTQHGISIDNLDVLIRFANGMRAFPEADQRRVAGQLISHLAPALDEASLPILQQYFAELGEIEELRLPQLDQTTDWRLVVLRRIGDDPDGLRKARLILRSSASGADKRSLLLDLSEQTVTELETRLGAAP